MLTIRELLLLASAYLLGCVTTGYYLVRCVTGQDIRQHGSKSVGASNVGRLLGWRGFLLTFLGDLGKGSLAVVIAHSLSCRPPIHAAVMVAVVVGHIWPLPLKFHGGKGVATALGAVLAYDYHLLLILIPLFLVLLLLFRRWTYTGLAVITLAPVAAILLGWERSGLLGLFMVVLLILWAHRSYLRVH